MFEEFIIPNKPKAKPEEIAAARKAAEVVVKEKEVERKKKELEEEKFRLARERMRQHLEETAPVHEITGKDVKEAEEFAAKNLR